MQGEVSQLDEIDESIGLCVKALLADRTRQGGRLGIDDLCRTVSRKELSPAGARSLLYLLVDTGVTLERPADPDYRVASTKEPRKRDSDGSAVAELLQGFSSNKLLDHPAEKMFGRRCRFGRLLLEAEITSDHPNHGWIIELADAARETMITSNLRLVVSIAKAYAKRVSSLALDDLIQEGSIGLMKAVGRYEPEMDFRFSTYATWWIDQAIGRAIHNKDRLIRLPTHVMSKIAKLRKKRRRLALDLGREPSNLELARDMGCEVGEIELLTFIWQETTCSDQSFEELEHVCDSSPSRPYIERPENSLDDAELRECLDRSFKRLHPREAHILRRRFGLNGTEKSSLITVGDELGLTRERIRQLEAKALEKLAVGPEITNLADFLYAEQNG